MSSFALYLTDRTKNKYMVDFQKLLNLPNSEFWSIDDGLKETLIRINKNPHYQTLFSKKHQCQPNTWDLGGESYLEITSFQDSWAQLLYILNEIKSLSTYFKSPVELIECDPHDNIIFNPNSPLEIGCIKDPDYFRIKYFKISIDSSDTSYHEKFWECIKSKFPK